MQDILVHDHLILNNMKKDVQKFEEIISESKLLDEEMEALRGGVEIANIQCGGGLIAHCTIGTDDQSSVEVID